MSNTNPELYSWQIVKGATSLHQHWDTRNSKGQYHGLHHYVDLLHPFPFGDMKKLGAPSIPSFDRKLAAERTISVFSHTLVSHIKNSVVTNAALVGQWDRKGEEQGATSHPLTTSFMFRFTCSLRLAPPLQRLDSPVAPRRCRSVVPAVTRLLTDVTYQQSAEEDDNKILSFCTGFNSPGLDSCRENEGFPPFLTGEDYSRNWIDRFKIFFCLCLRFERQDY